MQAKEAVCGLIRRGAILAVLLAALLALSCGGQTEKQRRRAIPEVSTITVRAEKIMESTELPGRTSAYRIAEIRPQVNGLIQKRLFTEGSDVRAGQTLYQIDPAPFEAALASATAALAKAEANLPSIKSRAERYKSLAAAKAVSQQDYDDAASALAQAKADILYWRAAVRTARINLGYTKVTAPIAGRIGKSNVTVGAIVTAYQPQALATIQQLDPVYVDVPQSTSDLLQLKRRLESGSIIRSGQGHNKVKLFLEDGTPYPLEGTLQFRDVSVDPTTGSVILRMTFPNPDDVLLPEMFVRTVIQEGINDHAILIPQQAVSRNPKGDPYALIVDSGNKVVLRMLTIDRAVGDKWLVSAGLAPGDRVILEGLQKVRPGATAKPVPYKNNAAPPAGSSAPSAGAK
ncbi:MAG: efflux RND transporter periplasmic adaptor subunit [Deltaproteobacteria bacterium]|nr:efflux RND transporter periplasmic adaptor subunit [Deltaproteobacteria bacterium]